MRICPIRGLQPSECLKPFTSNVHLNEHIVIDEVVKWECIFVCVLCLIIQISQDTKYSLMYSGQGVNCRFTCTDTKISFVRFVFKEQTKPETNVS